jgi:hypothetical protein
MTSSKVSSSGSNDPIERLQKDQHACHTHWPVSETNIAGPFGSYTPESTILSRYRRLITYLRINIFLSACQPGFCNIILTGSSENPMHGFQADSLETRIGRAIAITAAGDARRYTGLDAAEWAVGGAKLGAGEICINSIDQDGTHSGFDLGIALTS